jgi:hypothetical protein
MNIHLYYVLGVARYTPTFSLRSLCLCGSITYVPMGFFLGMPA